MYQDDLETFALFLRVSFCFSLHWKVWTLHSCKINSNHMLHNIAFGTTYLSTWPNKLFSIILFYAISCIVPRSCNIHCNHMMYNIKFGATYYIRDLIFFFLWESSSYYENITITLKLKLKKKNDHKRIDTATRIIEFSLMHYPCQISIWCSKKYFVWLSISTILQKSNILNVNCVNATLSQNFSSI